MSPQPPDWGRVETVLLDLDGTLLDRHFDDHFWTEFVPSEYARFHGISPGKARELLLRRFREEEGTLNWYDVDYWSRELGLDIPALKRQVEHLITVHPHVIEFLERARAGGRRVFLVTNAHGKSLRLKMERTLLAGHFDGFVVSHDLGIPKENPDFWTRVRPIVGFEPSRTLFADDTLRVLEAAERCGIAFLVHVVRPSSTLRRQASGRFFSVETFAEIMPP